MTHTRMQNSKFNILKLNPLKMTFRKQPVIAKGDIKVSITLANKSEVKAKNFVIPISFYRNKLVVTPPLFPSLFFILRRQNPFWFDLS